MTDEEWQNIFQSLRSSTLPSPDSRMMKPTGSIGYSAYKGQTSYQQYCSWINDVLLVLRSGGTDYCYYYYQLADLLRFEKYRLRSSYQPEEQFWIVWLENHGGKYGK